MGVLRAVLPVIEVVGGTAAGFGANMVVQDIVTSYGLNAATNKVSRVCVGCASWALGCYANKKVSEIFVAEADETVDTIEGFVDTVKQLAAKHRESEDD